MHRIIVIGGNFAGLTCALELKRKLGYACNIVMISKLPYFIFIPSLIWIPFSKRELEDIAIPLDRITSKANINLFCTEAIEIRPEEKLVRCTNKDFNYDYLVVATGPKWDRNEIKVMGKNKISYIFDIELAIKTRQNWKAFIKNPGPVVIGGVQGIQCIGPAYEFLFNFEKQCRREGIRNKVDITFITPEPSLGHLGMGGIIGSSSLFENLMSRLNIKSITNVTIKKVTNQAIILSTAQSLPYKFSMIMPKFEGADLIKGSIGLGDENGFLPVNEGYQHVRYADIFGVGSAANPPFIYRAATTSMGVAKTGFAAIVSAKIAAENIRRLIKGYDQLKLKPIDRLPELCVLSSGHKEIFTIALPLLKPRIFSLALLDPMNEYGKIAVEKYFLWKFRHGYSKLPP